MSDQLANRKPSSELSLTAANMKALLANPSNMIPPEVRPALLECWATHRHLTGMETAFAIAAPMAVWINRHGLHPDDAIAVLLEMQRPENYAKHVFASDLLSSIGGYIANKISFRKSQEQQARSRAEDAEARAHEAALTPEDKLARSAELKRIREEYVSRQTVTERF